jgi:toxin ParE1/3/4
MSARKRHLVLTPEARSDLSDILLYTEQQWGLAQVRSYNAQLRAAFEQLTQYPDMGVLRPEFGPGTRSYRVRQHAVIYRPSDTELRIVRILHIRRDHNAEFE